MRRQVGMLLGAAACTVLVPLTASLAFGPVPPEAMPTRAATPGTYHVAVDPNELAATISDTAPPVPCDRPHQTETVWIHQIDGPLAREVERPNPELLGATLDARCNDYTRLRAYLGAEPNDNHWGLSMFIKVPTRAEWAEGDRTLRCEAVAAGSESGRPVMKESISGILRRTASARYRLCWSAGAAVTCDQAHDAEALSPNVILPDGPWPGGPAVEAMAADRCAPIAQQYLMASLASRPDLKVAFDIPTAASWATGDRNVDCNLASRTGKRMLGTLRGGLL